MHQNQYLSQPRKIDSSKEPTRPGTYWAQEISYDMGCHILLSNWFRAKVIRSDGRLLVLTGCRRPKFKTLNCYAWGSEVVEERAAMKAMDDEYGSEQY